MKKYLGVFALFLLVMFIFILKSNAADMVNCRADCRFRSSHCR